MLQIGSAYLTAVATLFGVLLTVGVQAITSATQRRHERIARTFDIRLELYAKMRRAIADWSETHQLILQLASELNTYVKQSRDELAAVVAKTEGSSSNESDLTDVPSDQAATTPQATAEQLLKEVEDYKKDHAANHEKIAGKASTLAGHVQKLKAARDELKEMSHKVALLAGKPVDEALAKVLNKVLSDTTPNKLDFDEFDRVAKKELGVKS